MKITILAFGTRGDVQPLLGLGKALQAAGNQVRMIASGPFKGWIERHGLEAIAARVDIQAVMQSEVGLDWIEHGTSKLKQPQAMKNALAPHIMAMMEDAWRASQGAGALISSFTSDSYAVSIAEKLGIKHISAALQPPLAPTRHGPSTTGAIFARRASLINYAFTRWIVEPFAWRLMGAHANQFRQETLGLPAQTWAENRLGLRRMLVVNGYSAALAPHAPDWPANIHTTGYWFLDEDQGWQPPPDLAAFLEAGPPPVYAGFGSMTGRDPQALTRLIVAAFPRQRVVLQSGWANLGDLALPANVFLLDHAPHSRLFPLMGAVVHHGGAGTTAESVRAGAPAVVVPHLADQPYWGARLAQLGAGPAPIPRNRLTAERLAAAAARATADPVMRQRAAALGARLRAEDGIGRAVALIQAHLAG